MKKGWFFVEPDNWVRIFIVMANSKIPRPTGTYSIRIDSGTLNRTSMPQPGVIGVMNQASFAEVEQAKHVLATDIGQLILDITGIFDPSPLSDGTNLLISLARRNWVDAVTSAVSIVPYIGDLSKTVKLPRYIKSIRKAIHIAKFDAKWANALRTLFTKLTKVLDECIKLAADVLPDSARTHLKELKYEVDKFLDPPGGTINKLADSGKKADFRPSSNSTKSLQNIDHAKPSDKFDKKRDKRYDSTKNNGPKTTSDLEGIEEDRFKIDEKEKKSSRKGKFKTKPLLKDYKGEEIPHNPDNWLGGHGHVKYLTDAELPQYKVTIQNGKLYDANGNLFDTSKANTWDGKK
jgi:hypothetical protein